MHFYHRAELLEMAAAEPGSFCHAEYCTAFTTASPYCARHLDEYLGLAIRPSTLPGGGLGLFATRFFKRGVTIDRYAGVVRSHHSPGRYVMQTLSGRFIDAAQPNSCAIRFANDNTPAPANVHCLEDWYGHVDACAKRPIQPGEELFLHYGSAYWHQHPKTVSLAPVQGVVAPSSATDVAAWQQLSEFIRAELHWPRPQLTITTPADVKTTDAVPPASFYWQLSPSTLVDADALTEVARNLRCWHDQGFRGFVCYQGTLQACALAALADGLPRVRGLDLSQAFPLMTIHLKTLTRFTQLETLLLNGQTRLVYHELPVDRTLPPETCVTRRPNYELEELLSALLPLSRLQTLYLCDLPASTTELEGWLPRLPSTLRQCVVVTRHAPANPIHFIKPWYFKEWIPRR